jgi:hypothetical protein
MLEKAIEDNEIESNQLSQDVHFSRRDDHGDRCDRHEDGGYKIPIHKSLQQSMEVDGQTRIGMIRNRRPPKGSLRDYRLNIDPVHQSV